MPHKETVRYGYLKYGCNGWILKAGTIATPIDDLCLPHEHKLVEVRIREIKESTQEATLMSKVQILESTSVPVS